MKSRTLVIGLALACAAIAGCLPEKRIAWSPDGRMAAIVAEKGIFFCDGDGKVLARLEGQFSNPAWLNDSRLVAVRNQPVATWDELTKVADQQTREDAAVEAEVMYKAAMKYEGKWDEFWKGKTPNDAGAIILYLKDHYSKELSAKIGADWDNLIKDFKLPVYWLDVYEWAKDGAKQAKILCHYLDAISGAVPSPDGKAVAFTVSGRDGTTLMVAAADGAGKPTVVAENASFSPGWARDGKSLAYMQGTSKLEDGGQQLASLVVSQVRGDDGAILEKFPSGVAMVQLVTDAAARIRGIGEAKFLFATREFSLPGIAKNEPTKSSLYVLTAGKNEPLLKKAFVPKDEGSAESVSEWFEVSPDGEKAALLGTDGTVGIVSLETGKSEIVQPLRVSGKGDDSRLVMPSWRSSSELCFLVPPGSEHGSKDRWEMVLCSTDEKASPRYKCISKDWPNSLVEGLLIKPATQPATSPMAK